MPQLDFSTFMPQIFWLFVSLSILYLILSKYALPRVSDVIEERKDILAHDIDEAKKIQREYYKKHGTTLRGMMDNHGVDPDHFLAAVHKLDYSIVGPNHQLGPGHLRYKYQRLQIYQEKLYTILKCNDHQDQVVQL